MSRETSLTRRTFAASIAAAALCPIEASAATPFPVHYARASPYNALQRHIAPGSDAFAGEKEAAEIQTRLRRIFAGEEPAPAALTHWVERRTHIRSARFFVLPEARIRFEISMAGPGGLEYHTGLWRASDFSEIATDTVTAAKPYFRDATAHVFGASESFREQLLCGNPFWRARLDSASGIDVDGNQGISAADIDNDGFDEIYVCQPGGLPNRLYKIGPDGRATDITARSGLGILDETTCVLFADFRNSGIQDVVVLRRDGPLLFLNQGNGVFREQPHAFRFAKPPQGSFTGMAAADYDRDGRLDLYLCTYVYVQGEDQYQYPVPYCDAQNGPPNYLFRNRAAGGGLRFDDVTAESGIDQNNNRFSFAAAWCDFDGDGWPDLYVANDFGRNNLYRNRGGRFTDEAARAGVEDIGAGMSASWFDYDGDGRPDLYVSNMWSAPGQRVVRDAAFAPAASHSEEYRRHAKGNSLFRNKGDGTFDDSGAAEKVEMGRWAWSSGGFDFDLDGSPEILIASGMVSNGSQVDLESFFWRQVVAKSPSGATARGDYENGWNAIGQFFRENLNWNGDEPNVFYRRRDGRYVDASGLSGLDFASNSRAFAVTDFDQDGYPDIILKSRLAPQIRAMQNQCAEGRRAISLRLVGTKSNRDAIGARVTVNGSTQEIAAGSGFLSQHSKRLHFGLNGKDSAEVRIVWPSGLIQTLHGLAAGSAWAVTEGDDHPSAAPFRPRREYPVAPIEPRNEAEFSDTWLLEPIPDPGGHKGPAVVTIDESWLRAEGDEIAAAYALVRRYIFEYRAEFTVPFALLIDERGGVRKIYRAVPSDAVKRADLESLTAGTISALPFPGRYFTKPARNYFKLGVAFYWAGYPRRALPYFEEALRSRPDNWRAMLALGEVHQQTGDVDASLKWFRDALSAHPGYPPAMVSIGILLLRKNDEGAARKMFANALELDPLSAEAANQLGLLAIRAHDTDGARQWFQRAIEAQPDHSGALNNLAVLFAQTGRYDESISVFRFGIDRLPDDEPLNVNLARVYAIAGQRDLAVDTLESYLERNPGSGLARKVLSDLVGR
ncbi:MAG TPA: FG-GAP-like repeat-containing protein [Bryobacteraceae bacterium]|nr:FG-GAP-like repeat-containing protein [Bryobacteraceae bacterium]